MPGGYFIHMDGRWAELDCDDGTVNGFNTRFLVQRKGALVAVSAKKVLAALRALSEHKPSKAVLGPRLPFKKVRHRRKSESCCCKCKTGHHRQPAIQTIPQVVTTLKNISTEEPKEQKTKDYEYKELFVDLSDVEYIKRTAKTDVFGPFDEKRFNQDDVYRNNVLFKFIPIVKLIKSPHIDELVTNQYEDREMSLKEFAASLGLTHIDDQVYKHNYRTRQKKKVDYESFSDEKENFRSKKERSARKNELTVLSSRDNDKDFAVKKQTSKPKYKKNKIKNFQPVRSVNREYSTLEDHAIVAWLSTGGREKKVNGNSVWRELQVDYQGLTGISRSWHSLRNRYLRYILPSLGKLYLSPKHQSRLRAAAAKGIINLARKKSLQRRNSIFSKSPVKSAWAAKPKERVKETPLVDKSISAILGVKQRQEDDPSPVTRSIKRFFETTKKKNLTKINENKVVLEKSKFVENVELKKSTRLSSKKVNNESESEDSTEKKSIVDVDLKKSTRLSSNKIDKVNYDEQTEGTIGSRSIVGVDLKKNTRLSSNKVNYESESEDNAKSRSTVDVDLKKTTRISSKDSNYESESEDSTESSSIVDVDLKKNTRLSSKKVNSESETEESTESEDSSKSRSIVDVDLKKSTRLSSNKIEKVNYDEQGNTKTNLETKVRSIVKVDLKKSTRLSSKKVNNESESEDSKESRSIVDVDLKKSTRLSSNKTEKVKYDEKSRTENRKSRATVDVELKKNSLTSNKNEKYQEPAKSRKSADLTLALQTVEIDGGVTRKSRTSRQSTTKDNEPGSALPIPQAKRRRLLYNPKKL